MNLRRVLQVVCLVIATSSTAFAHPQEGLTGDGLGAGFLHPWFGFDHLLAMIAVGLLSVQMGGRAIWILPAAFSGMMVAGGIVGMNGVPFHFVECGIALTVIALGAALAFGVKYPLITAAIFIGTFGLTHGHAHGTEMPAMAAPVFYAAGFVGATALLHLIGIAGGLGMKCNQRWVPQFRLSGVAISLAGVGLLLGVL
ncbi:HupE / UreJ protein [Bremerella volcania]|uniref:HupE / UreJ protein n=1 Tax=Bremerella volcania TaxID=2527984 RepID=A0A518CEB5_9BACT|nr:HupE/UreJ family protein [Bremerella volcania]QDU77570.1 HupE / UreJ protein [Bremerella volcania]